MPRTFTRRTLLPAPADEVFAWHARPGAFERLVPPWERVRTVERTGGIENGARLVLAMRAGPVRLRWVAVHRDVVPGREFTDEQVAGPFARWVHRHQITPSGPEACELVDHIEYALPLGALSEWTAPVTVVPRLERMFRYRHDVTEADLALHGRHRDVERLRIGVTGARGLVGSRLVPLLTTGGHDVVRFTRQAAPGPDEATWVPSEGLPPEAGPLDAIVHLAGANVAGRRWSDDWKQEIRDSRVGPTRALAESVARWPRPPHTLICASAVGFYGNCGDRTVDETTGPGDGFLAEVCRDWEAATSPAVDAGIRVVVLRIGVVLSPVGGALAGLLPAFLAGVGGRVGTGRQFMSWVGIDDVAGAVVHALCSPAITGAVNVCAPDAVTNAVFTRTLARVVRRPAVLRVPSPVLRAAYGELADTLVGGAKVYPGVLERTGYRFRHRSLEAALRHLLGRGDATATSAAGAPPPSE